MNEQLQTQLAGILSVLTNAVSKASDFVVAELPPVVHEYLVYSQVSVTVGYVVALVIFGISVRLVKVGLAKSRDWGTEGEGMLMCGSGCIAGLMSMAYLLGELSTLVMVWFAPKVYLLKTLAQLIK